MKKINKQPIVVIGGARPNFMKISPLISEMKKQGIFFKVINTNQHYDDNMSGSFFREFKIKPDFNLDKNNSSLVEQFSYIMSSLEKIFKKINPCAVVVVGDVNSTLAAGLVANKLKIKLAHVEAGLRSYNKNMPEEYNRVLTDHLADYLFTTSEDGSINLKKEGIVNHVYYVGNVMIDTLKLFLPNIRKTKEKFYFCTLHRAENVDNKEILIEILNALEHISKDCKIYLPLHPRTEKMAKKFKLMGRFKEIFDIIPPLGYKDSIFYQKNAKLILTDSGGVQEESSFLGVPCLTLRTETERPISVSKGTNTVAGITTKSILKAYKNKKLLHRKTNIIYWDGKASQRIVNIIKKNI